MLIYNFSTFSYYKFFKTHYFLPPFFFFFRVIIGRIVKPLLSPIALVGEVIPLPIANNEGLLGGAFHTTADSSFYRGGTLSPKAGGSELPGVYGSTQVSTPFSRIAGSGSKTKLFPGLKDLFSTDSSPGIAFIKPKGFRKPKMGYTNKPTFEGQKKVGGKYGFFKQKPKEGIAEVPGIKSEIETIFRPGAGDYVVDLSKHYTIIKGVRVPLDSLSPESGFKIPGATKKGGAKGGGKKIVKVSDYKGYRPPARIDVSSGIGSSGFKTNLKPSGSGSSSSRRS
ncbi:unnamed protein product, partial [marine sediment metagenome]